MTALRAHRLEVALLAGATIAALVALRLVGTQIYTEPGTIDPWLYTALMANFDFTYHWFHTTYYASRLPLVLPGLLLNGFLTPEHAYVVFHLTFFLAGGIFVYLLARSLFGVRVALFVYPAVLTNAIYVDTHTWDYFDGAVITYLSGGLYFLVSSIGRTSHIRPLLAGFFLAAAVATNLFAMLLVLGALGAYVYGRATVDRRAAARRVALDALWLSLGALVLLALCGWFAKAHGGRFLFFMPSVDALRTIHLEAYKLPTYDWIRGEPRLLVPLFLGVTAAVAWSRGRRNRAGGGLGVLGAGVAIYIVLAIWEFGRSGTFLQIAYYYSTLFPFLFVGLAATVFGLLERGTSVSHLRLTALPVVGLVAGAAPIVVIYGFNRPDLLGERGAVITLVLMASTLVTAALLQFATGRRLAFVLAPLAAAMAIGSANYGSAANTTTNAGFETHNSALADADETFAIGAQLMAFMQRGGFQESLPAFWYDPSEDVALIGLQSLYYYGYTLITQKLPVVDEEFRGRTRQLRPKHVVLLCAEPTCRGGGDAMRRAGYQIHRAGAKRLHSGSKSVWVEAYALESPTPSP